jgi:hypothetical protein
MCLIAGSAKIFNRWFCGGQAKVPGIFVGSRLAARAKPLRYTNTGIKAAMGWKPRFTLKESLDRSTSVKDAALEEVRAGVMPPPEEVKGAA